MSHPGQSLSDLKLETGLLIRLPAPLPLLGCAVSKLGKGSDSTWGGLLLDQEKKSVFTQYVCVSVCIQP